MNRIFISVLAVSLVFFQQMASANIRELFKNNQAIIYAINIRNFASYDKNGNGIIEPDEGERSGTFLSAKERIKELKDEGINVIYVLPITPIGKLKAMGTAGSLYALNAFDKINSQLDDTTNNISVYDEAREFINEAHKYNINVIVDLPSCGSYELSLNKPDWFMHNENNEAIIPADWTDVRLFRIYNNDKTLYEPILNNFKSFVDMVKKLGFDGIRADVAAIKPPQFWKEIIDYARKDNDDFLFLAEASSEWTNPTTQIKHYSTIDELLNAGFDTYYGPWSDFKNFKSKHEFDMKIEKNIKILNKYKDKSIMASFATHDQQAPILRGKNYWNTILWLSTTLPVNTYFLDGFSTGDDFTYDYEGKKTDKSMTDDEYYYVHSGMFDIFNINAPAVGKYLRFKKEYVNAIGFKKNHLDLIKKENFKTLSTNNDKVFAYSLANDKKELIVIVSLDEKNTQQASVKSKYLKNEHLFSTIKIKTPPKTVKDTINAELEPLELQVYLINQVNSPKKKHFFERLR